MARKILLEAKTGMAGFPCVLEADDSSWKLAVSGENFVITAVKPEASCLNEFTGSSLIVYDNGLVILYESYCSHIFAIHDAKNKPLNSLFSRSES